MSNTRLLKDLIAHAQAAGNALISSQYNETEYLINDVCIIAEGIGEPGLSRCAKHAVNYFNRGLYDAVDRALHQLITAADRFLGRI